ncbi:MAG: glucosamine-6-phosphate deaminase [Erysipelotrichaceae bacterium]|jgi:glucosamine-6-phosphate deaminase|nr:glucosamine-6-phosphate deaminase [Erysipelotrichaceae bacterium]
MRVIVCENYEEVSDKANELMRFLLESNPQAVLGLATGSSPIGLYQRMIADNKAGLVSFKQVVTYNLDEYVGLPKDHSQTYYTFMHENLFDHIDIPKNSTHIPDGTAADPELAAAQYEEALSKVQVDLQILGIGSNGHIGFNEPGTSFDATTHVTPLTQKTISDNARFFDDDLSKVPTKAITMGIADILRAKRVLLIATGEKKQQAIWGLVKGPVTEECPASALKDHKDVTVIIDKAAAGKL